MNTEMNYFMTFIVIYYESRSVQVKFDCESENFQVGFYTMVELNLKFKNIVISEYFGYTDFIFNEWCIILVYI